MYVKDLKLRRETLISVYISNIPKRTGLDKVPVSGAPNENIVQNHLNIALLNVF